MDDGFTPGFIVGGLVAAIISAFTISGMMDYYREKAVKAGVARYEVIVATGKTKFLWNEDKP